MESISKLIVNQLKVKSKRGLTSDITNRVLAALDDTGETYWMDLENYISSNVYIYMVEVEGSNSWTTQVPDASYDVDVEDFIDDNGNECTTGFRPGDIIIVEDPESIFTIYIAKNTDSGSAIWQPILSRHGIQLNATSQPDRPNLNFTGDVLVTDDPSQNRLNIEIVGGAGGSSSGLSSIFEVGDRGVTAGHAVRLLDGVVDDFANINFGEDFEFSTDTYNNNKSPMLHINDDIFLAIRIGETSFQFETMRINVDNSISSSSSMTFAGALNVHDMIIIRNDSTTCTIALSFNYLTNIRTKIYTYTFDTENIDEISTFDVSIASSEAQEIVLTTHNDILIVTAIWQNTSSENRLYWSGINYNNLSSPSLEFDNIELASEIHSNIRVINFELTHIISYSQGALKLRMLSVRDIQTPSTSLTPDFAIIPETDSSSVDLAKIDDDRFLYVDNIRMVIFKLINNMPIVSNSMKFPMNNFTHSVSFVEVSILKDTFFTNITPSIILKDLQSDEMFGISLDLHIKNDHIGWHTIYNFPNVESSSIGGIIIPNSNRSIVFFSTGETKFFRVVDNIDYCRYSTIIGIAKTSEESGSNVEVGIAGHCEVSGMSWTTNMPHMVSDVSGELISSISIQEALPFCIGIAVSPTTMLINPQSIDYSNDGFQAIGFLNI